MGISVGKETAAFLFIESFEGCRVVGTFSIVTLYHHHIPLFKKYIQGKKHGSLSFQSILAWHLFTRLPWSNNTDLLLIFQQSNWRGNVLLICCRDLWHWLLAHLTLGWSLDPSKWSLFFRYSALFGFLNWLAHSVRWMLCCYYAGILVWYGLRFLFLDLVGGLVMVLQLQNCWYHIDSFRKLFVSAWFC